MSIPDRAEPIRGERPLPSQDVRGGDDPETIIGFTSIFPDRRPAVDFGIFPDVTGISDTTKAFAFGLTAEAPTN